MTSIFEKLWSDEAGVILSAELVIILTIAVLGMVVGLSNLQHALTAEFTDLSAAFQSLNQSYCTPSYRGCTKWGWGSGGWGAGCGWGGGCGWGRPTSWVAGSCFYDAFDGCVGYSTDGCGPCEIYGASNFGCVSNACPTGACATGTSVTDDAANLPSPAPLNSQPLPIPDPASTSQPQTTR